MKAVGISLGASSVKAVEIERNSGIVGVKRVFVQSHEGDPKAVLMRVLEEFALDGSSSVAVTGRALRHQINLTSISEPLALELALESTHQDGIDVLVSVGGENFIVYTLNRQGKISNLYTGGKCASGTGEFFFQQIRRMNITADEALKMAQSAQPREISGRCSVFCKSDCTHALNRGEPMGEIVAGLCQMMANKILELLAKTTFRRIMVIGGVTQNLVVMDFLRQEIEDLVIPEKAVFFEALGAALFALNNETLHFEGQELFQEGRCSFEFLPPISSSCHLVEFKEMERSVVDLESEYILGLDVGSTTTKAVIVRLDDLALVADIYLRTNGDPVGASRNCYRELLNQVPEEIKIVGLGTTGSGRQIAGLHALTSSVINEIISHASAATYFDSEVDTIFEIGGQDAKYTYLWGGVACDYAMNEACSAGTGSFLEESAKETLGLEMEEIASHALVSERSPNFNDQCAAFISSDIKTAAQESIERKDIVAGLVYSICMNYDNRVKGNRPVGRRVFMQGGVCYNRAVPLAMAQLTGKRIIVPPEPGLMGAFGVAREVKSRIDLGLIEKKRFNLKELAEREVRYKKPFTCKATKGCDRKCRIELIEIGGDTYPFGGACNRYYNLRINPEDRSQGLNLVDYRERLLFKDYSQRREGTNGRRIGLNRSFLIHQLFPFYYHFFCNLGLEVVLPEEMPPEGLYRQRAAFCYPAAISHGFFANLLNKELDYIFLPQVLELPVENSVSEKKEHQSTCHLLQAEPYYLKAAFKDMIHVPILTELLDFSDGYEQVLGQFVNLGKRLGFKASKIEEAYRKAVDKQIEFEKVLKEKGREVLAALEPDPERFAVVLFSHPYNGLPSEANMAIPQKFASRGIDILPFELLPFEDALTEEGRDFLTEDMTWAHGQMLIRGASFVKSHPQLFGVYITNFSCGPDSFITGYFRDIMGEKPSLTLELDSHTQDVGLDTRVEAFLEIINRYRQLKTKKNFYIKGDGFSPARIVVKKRGIGVVSSSGRELELRDPKVKMLIPPMGKFGSEALAAVLEGLGVNTEALPTPDMETLKMGRAQTTTKECLPLQLTTGSLLRYMKEERKDDEILVYFMPTGSGNCRFPQYNVSLKRLIKKNEVEDVTVVSLSNETGYLGFGYRLTLPGLRAVILADVMDDIRNALLALARDKEEALDLFDKEWQSIIDNLRGRDNLSLEKRLLETAMTLNRIPLTHPLHEAKIVSLHGEIYVRKELFSRGSLVETLANQGIVVKTASVLEWLHYVDYLIRKGIIEGGFGLTQWVEFLVKRTAQSVFEKRIKRILSKSGLYEEEPISIKELVEGWSGKLLNVALTGEPVLTIGAALKEVGHSVCGLVSIGPFGCLPSRVTESILSCHMNIESKKACQEGTDHLSMEFEVDELPFLPVEVDGNPFPPIIQARIEAFCLQVERLYLQMRKLNKN
ncbi:TPA: activase [bacterium]|nr:activase [bacterium]